ncbi:MAG: D-alanyl-D-alanine carboxypeptidase [Clostridia bacterium]|nr:D-alanyl-D-alanine carboxypeptidase [Clostridia bacterium]
MKKSVIFVILASFLLSLLLPVHSFASYNDEISDISSDIVYVISLDNGNVIFDKNCEKKTAPASMTKLMTALLTLENISDMTKQLTVSQSSVDMLAGTGALNASLVAGERMTVRDLLYCLLIPNANDAACVLAETIGGTVPAFVGMMNDKAQKLGLTGTHYVNPHGLDEDGQYTTARDVAIIVQEALKYPLFEKITSAREYTVPATNMSDERALTSTNLMMNPYYDSYYLSYVKGINTGATANSGRCVVTKASKDGYTYLAVVMGGKDKDGNGSDYNGAFADCKKVLGWTYSNIKYKVVADIDQTISVSELKYCWKTDHIRLVPVEEVYALVPRSLDASSLYYELSDELNKPLKASIKKGDVVGTATAYYGGNPIATIDLTVEETVHHSVILHILSVFKAAWNNLFGKVVIIALALTVIVLLLLRKLVKKGVIDISEIRYNRNLKKHLK